MPVLEAVPFALPKPEGWRQQWRYGLSLIVAGFLHIAAIAAVLPGEIDMFGDGGDAVEAMTVAIVGSVPVFSAPEARPTDAVQNQPDGEEVPPEAENDNAKLEERVVDPKPPESPKLSIEAPLEPTVEPPPEAITLPIRPPEIEPKPDQVAKEEPPPPIEEPQPKTANAAEPPPPPPPQMESVSSAEATPGEIRAFVKEIMAIVDRARPSVRSVKGQQGRVMLRFYVTDTGKPDGVVVLRSSGSDHLDRLALGVVEKLQLPQPPAGIAPKDREVHLPFDFKIGRTRR